jgi:signal transduction histidine kinase
VVPDGLRVDVSDDGPGIEPWLQAQLFTRFMRGSDGINSSERGLGLGLAIARELIEQQGGRLWLAMTSIHGSTFSFVLPSASVQCHHTSEEALAYA